MATKQKKGVCPHAINLKACNKELKLWIISFLAWSTEAAKEIKAGWHNSSILTAPPPPTRKRAEVCAPPTEKPSMAPLGLSGKSREWEAQLGSNMKHQKSSEPCSSASSSPTEHFILPQALQAQKKWVQSNSYASNYLERKASPW